MKFCQDHWDELRGKIIELGMGDLIPGDGETAAMALIDQSEQGATKVNYDPLMGAHNAIVHNAMELAGFMNIMCPNDDGSDRCPLCYIIKEAVNHNADPEAFKLWIGYAANGQLELAQELGLVKSSPDVDGSTD